MSEIKLKTITKTRKIEIYIDEQDFETRKQIRQTWWDWEKMVMDASNTAAAHMYVQEEFRKFSYLNEDFKNNNPEIFKAGKGYSPSNRSYRVLAEEYKGKLPADIYSNLNNRLHSTFSKQKKEYFKGSRKLMTFTKGLPIPFSAKSMLGITLADDERNYCFTIFGYAFKTRFGKDLSNNRSFWERAMEYKARVAAGGDKELQVDEYKLCDSAIKMDGAKMFLDAVFQFVQDKNDVDPHKIAEASLSVFTPIALKIKDKVIDIGGKEEFLAPRLKIQASLRREMIRARYNLAKDRKNKLAETERFKKFESRYVEQVQHKYSKKAVDLCLRYKCGTLLLKYVHDRKPPDGLDAKGRKLWYDENQPLLRNWTYYGLTEKLKYKCEAVGIKLVIEKKRENPELNE